MAEYLHPSVSSKIIDNSTSFVSAQGVTQLFAAFTSDTGPDNRVVSVTSPSEYLFYFGKPNMKKHGQAAYNVLNWLNSGGGVYALRVMPDNAGYSHVFLNVQTQSGTKQVKDKSGTLVSVPDVTIRTAVGFTGVNNTSEAGLQSFVTSAMPDTVDGFQNHTLVGFFAKGRGKDYDNLGVRLTLTDAYDETHAFRVYNLEVLRTSDNGETSVIDGPFLVALSPDAINKSSQESMFIKYVVEKYSTYLNVVFNDAAYDALGAVVNPSVSPDRLDLVGGVTRVISGVRETSANAVTGKDEDLHLSLHKYDASGNPAKYANGDNVLNVIDTTSTAEAAIVSLDSSFRASTFDIRDNTVANFRTALSKVRGSSYAAHLDGFATFDAGGVITAGSIKVSSDAHGTAKTNLDTAESNYTTTPTAPNLTALKSSIGALTTALATTANALRAGLDAARALGDTADSTNAMTSLRSYRSNIVGDSYVGLRAADKIAAVDASTAAVNVASTGTRSAKLSATASALIVAKSAYDFAAAVAVAGEAEANTALTAAVTAYNSAATAYGVAVDANLLETEKDAKANDAVTAVIDALSKVKSAADLADLELSLSKVKAAVADLGTAKTGVELSIKAAKADVRTVPQKESTVANQITVGVAVANTAKAEAYLSALVAFSSSARFGKGSDGDLDEANPTRATAAKNLLMNAFKGVVDPNLTNKKLYPIDLVLDANYDADVKSAIVTLVDDIRKDFVGLLDTGFQADPSQVLDFRKNSLQVNSFRVGIFCQDFLVYDEHTGQDVRVTSTYYLAGKIPTVDSESGIHMPFVGPRRGTIEGFKKLSFNPTDAWKEQLYKKQVNYVVSEPRRTMFGSQLTSQSVVSALSNINNVRALLRIQREVEELGADYQFEFNDETTINSFQYNLNNLLSKWTANRACTMIKGTVYASDYDKQQKLVRVKVEMQFNSVIERVFIDLVVNR